MTDATLPAKKARKPAGLVEVAPDSEAPETRDKRSGGRGLVIGLGAAVVFWAVVGAAVVALRN